MRVRAYVDGFNFYVGCSHAARAIAEESGEPVVWKWLDIASWIAAMCGAFWPGASVVQASYFTAPVRAMDGDPGAHERQDVYMRALKAKGVEVVKGKFLPQREVRPLVLADGDPRSELPVADRSVEVWVNREKKTDVNLATALLVDYFENRGTFDASVVVSNDSDLQAAVHALRCRRWPTGVIVPRSKSYTKDLWPDGLMAPHFGVFADVPLMSSHQLEDPVTTPQGRQVRNPWA